MLSTVITNTSEPWVVVNIDEAGQQNKMGNYLIECKFLEEPAVGESVTLQLHA